MTESIEGRCATCRYWEGDHDRAVALFAINPISMDLNDGWAPDGECGIQYRWLTITIDGDATAEAEVPANFGCIHYERLNQ